MFRAIMIVQFEPNSQQRLQGHHVVTAQCSMAEHGTVNWPVSRQQQSMAVSGSTAQHSLPVRDGNHSVGGCNSGLHDVHVFPSDWVI